MAAWLAEPIGTAKGLHMNIYLDPKNKSGGILYCRREPIRIRIAEFWQSCMDALIVRIKRIRPHLEIWKQQYILCFVKDISESNYSEVSLMKEMLVDLHYMRDLP